MFLDLQVTSARLNRRDITQQIFPSSNWIISHYFMAACKKLAYSLPGRAWFTGHRQLIAGLVGRVTSGLSWDHLWLWWPSHISPLQAGAAGSGSASEDRLRSATKRPRVLVSVKQRGEPVTHKWPFWSPSPDKSLICFFSLRTAMAVYEAAVWKEIYWTIKSADFQAVLSRWSLKLLGVKCK